MRKAMVVRAGSAIGRELISKLVSLGIETVAFSKSETKLRELKESHEQHANLHTVRGNIRNTAELTAAAEGVDVIFCASYVTYDEKQQTVTTMKAAVMEAAQRTGAKVVMIEGVYRPNSEVNNQPADRISTVTESTIPILRIHSPELYGASARNTVIYYILKKITQAKSVKVPGSTTVKRHYLYLPDAASRIIDLASRASAYGEEWNLRSGTVISIEELSLIASSIVGMKPSLMPIKGWRLRLLQGYDDRMKEVLHRYEIATQQTQINSLIYEEKDSTPYEIGITETVSKMISLMSGKQRQKT